MRKNGGNKSPRSRTARFLRATWQSNAARVRLPNNKRKSTLKFRKCLQTKDNSQRDDAAIQMKTESDTMQKLLDVQTMVQVQRKPGEWKLARIVDRRIHQNLNGFQEYQYYVHYKGMNRRMDEWKSQSDIDLDTVLKVSHKFTKVKNIDQVELGRYEMDTWYFSPFPLEFRDCKKLYFSEFTLEFFKRREHMLSHLRKCELKHPPGNEIYRNDSLSMFEIDGQKEKQYCQNLSWLAKLFLDHKTLYWDVDMFLFYVLCECDDRGAHIVGYFSKIKGV